MITKIKENKAFLQVLLAVLNQSSRRKLLKKTKDGITI